MGRDQQVVTRTCTQSFFCTPEFEAKTKPKNLGGKNSLYPYEVRVYFGHCPRTHTRKEPRLRVLNEDEMENCDTSIIYFKRLLPPPLKFKRTLIYYDRQHGANLQGNPFFRPQNDT